LHIELNLLCLVEVRDWFDVLGLGLW